MLTDGSPSTPTGRRQAATPARRLTAFGLELETDFPLPGGRAGDTPSSQQPLTLTLVPWHELAPLVEDARVLSYRRSFDGCPYAMLEADAGDILFHYGDRALFHLSGDLSVLRCACARLDDPTWQRVLLDTVLWTTSLLRGFELFHASAVTSAHGLMAFVAASGGGKTSLAAEYLRRGAQLFCDDILALEAIGHHVICHPGPPLMNLPLPIQASGLGRADVIARFGDEQWVQLETPALSAQPLTAIVLLERAARMPARCSSIDATILTLLPHAAGFPHLRHRVKKSFEVLAEIASTVPVFRLNANPSVPAHDLADLVDQAVAAR